MEENKSVTNEVKSTNHILTLTNRNNLTLTGVEKVISIKPDMVQLNSNNGNVVITGQNIEVTKLDLEQKNLELAGKFDSIKYLDNNKTPFIKKIFK